jgi:NAD(P)-dependent dehydrogenase (short-subunit alcohol dehydrogenase family)
MLLKDKVAVVTGASQGIGLAIAQRCARQGALVVLADILTERGSKAAEALRSEGCDATFSEMDVTDESSIQDTLDHCLEVFGGVDILVNNAGVNSSKPVVDLSREEWEKVMAVNLTGAFLCSRLFARHMMEREEGGSILFMSSEAGKRGEAGASAYAASKFGVIGLMECLALELAPHGIRVNAVCPGDVDAPMLHWVLEQVAERTGVSYDEIFQTELDSIPLGRLASPTEIADVVVFLASPLASYITGESVNVDGGRLSG